MSTLSKQRKIANLLGLGRTSYLTPSIGFRRCTLHNNSPRRRSDRIIKRDLTTGGSGIGGDKPTAGTTKLGTFDNTLNTLRELHNYAKTHQSLDIWSISIFLLAIITGPVVWRSMKNSTLGEDDYGIPVDDPVEHSVRILLQSTGVNSGGGNIGSSSSSSDGYGTSGRGYDVTIISPEEDARCYLNDLLASENIRTTASRIASGVIQSPPFQNACTKLAKDIVNDLLSDPETTSQFTTLVHAVLQYEEIYSAVRSVLLQLVNDE